MLKEATGLACCLLISRSLLNPWFSSLRTAEPMRILISHTNFPAQFRRLAPALVEQGHEVVFIAKNRNGMRPILFQACELLPMKLIARVEVRHYIHILRRFEACVLEGQAVFRACQQLREEGWIPDWILNHVGFGNGLYLSDAFPEAKRIGLVRVVLPFCWC